MSIELFIIFHSCSSNINGISYYNISFNSDNSSLCLLFLTWLAWLEVYEFHWCFQRTSFWFGCIFSTVFSFSISLISSLLPAVGLDCSSFSSFLWWKFRLIILYIFPFLMYEFSAIQCLQWPNSLVQLNIAFLHPQIVKSCIFI